MKKQKLTKEEKKMKKKKSKVRKVIKALLLIILVSLVIAGSIFAYKVGKNGWSLQGLLATVAGHDQNTLKDLDKIYCLVIGRSQNLTDTIMVCAYDPKTQEASMLSIPRDTFVGKNKNYATAWDKINALYQKDPQKTIDAVCNITGLDIKYYVEIDTEALIDVVDTIGGVWFDVPIDMNYDDSSQDLSIHLKAGYQLLDGDKAEQVVRFRHNNNGTTYPAEYGQEDIGRMRTQREFLKEVAKQTLKPENILKVYNFLEIFKKNVQTNLDFNIIKDYVPYAVNFNTDNLKTGTLPGEAKKCNGVWIYLHDEEETELLVQQLFTGIQNEEIETVNDGTSVSTNVIKDDEETNKEEKEDSTTKPTKEEGVSTKYDIEIYNASGNSALLKAMVKKYEEEGYNVKTSATIATVAKTVIINRDDVPQKDIDYAKEIIGKGEIQKGEDNKNAEITIIIGKDYR